jgi:CRP-like cAMP-binding protein
MDHLLTYFTTKGMEKNEANLIASTFRPKLIGKGSYFSEEGKTSRHLAYIARGLFQYFYRKDGNEITTYVTGPGNFLASVASFYRQKPSKENIRALSDAEVWMLHYDELQKLKKESEGFKAFYIDALEAVIQGMDETRANLIILTAEERYALLLKEEPALLQQIPLQYLASILGVTPRHLSRIRNNIR